MKAIIILLAFGSVASALTYEERRVQYEMQENAAASQSSSSTKIMSFRTPDGDRITVEVPSYTQPGTRFVFRMPDGERVTVYLY
jgi:hypothetical protein